MYGLLLPVLNEINALKIIIPKAIIVFDKVIVIDGGSSDGSIEYANKMNCKVIKQKDRGKGRGIVQAWKYILNTDLDIIAMIDADGTCSIDDVMVGIDYLINNNCDIAIGNRFASKNIAMGNFSKFVNWLVSISVSIRVLKRYHDAQSPMWIWKKESIEFLINGITATMFEIEVDMLFQASYARLSICEFPISYSERIGKSKFTNKLRFRNLFILPYLAIKRRHGKRRDDQDK